MDLVSKEKRSYIMSRIRSVNTKPEIRVRKMLKVLDIPLRFHSKNLPGKPDIVINKKNIAIFVNGCFWHNHNCKNGKIPANNRKFWKQKIERNIQRDYSSESKLRRMGWHVYKVWECKLESGAKRIMKRISKINGNQ